LERLGYNRKLEFNNSKTNLSPPLAVHLPVVCTYSKLYLEILFWKKNGTIPLSSE